mmetsp:Transcript_57231/g.152637  ORF Transcript_57231/g.152637 Transcript_57231/m.152637 type:complete len:263 (-) Transcript_57231:79-867(-)
MDIGQHGSVRQAVSDRSKGTGLRHHYLRLLKKLHARRCAELALRTAVPRHDEGTETRFADVRRQHALQRQRLPSEHPRQDFPERLVNLRKHLVACSRGSLVGTGERADDPSARVAQDPVQLLITDTALGLGLIQCLRRCELRPVSELLARSRHRRSAPRVRPRIILPSRPTDHTEEHPVKIVPTFVQILRLPTTRRTHILLNDRAGALPAVAPGLAARPTTEPTLTRMHSEVAPLAPTLGSAIGCVLIWRWLKIHCLRVALW